MECKQQKSFMSSYLFQIIEKCFQDARDVAICKDVDFLVEENDWNDYGYITYYSIHATPKISKRDKSYYLGDIKIMKIGQKKHEQNLLRRAYQKNNLMFDRLPDDYVSLSLSVDFYENLQLILRAPEERKAFVEAVNMILGIDSPMYEKVKEDECFIKSLLRDSFIKDFALQQGRKIMLNEEILFDLRNETFTFNFPYSKESVNFNFCAVKDFSDSESIPNGIIALIGKNGSGKSTALYEIAKVLYASPDTRRLIADKIGLLGNNAIGISKLIMLSYSAFDNFILPGSTKQECRMLIDGIRNHTGRFVYCGIRDVYYDMNELYEAHRGKTEEEFIDITSHQRIESIRLKDPEKLGEEYVYEMSNLTKKDKSLWQNFILSIKERQPEFWYAIKDISEPILWKEVNIESQYKSIFNNLSTGYKFVMHSMAHLIANCDNNNLVLFDEPENHLQPPLLSFVMNEIRKVLAKYRSVMLIATHSPIILQEIFSKNVRVVRRNGNIRTFTQPKIETYGESFGTIASEVFNLNSDNTSYFHSIEMLYEAWGMDKMKSLEEMIYAFEEKLGNSLSSQMETFLIGKYSKSHLN